MQYTYHITYTYFIYVHVYIFQERLNDKAAKERTTSVRNDYCAAVVGNETPYPLTREWHFLLTHPLLFWWWSFWVSTCIHKTSSIHCTGAISTFWNCTCTLFAASPLICSWFTCVHDKMNSYSIEQCITHSSSLYNARACPMKSTVFWSSLKWSKTALISRDGSKPKGKTNICMCTYT